jgi:hypothetical protein
VEDKRTSILLVPPNGAGRHNCREYLSISDEERHSEELIMLRVATENRRGRGSSTRGQLVRGEKKSKRRVGRGILWMGLLR